MTKWEYHLKNTKDGFHPLIVNSDWLKDNRDAIDNNPYRYIGYTISLSRNHHAKIFWWIELNEKLNKFNFDIKFEEEEYKSDIAQYPIIVFYNEKEYVQFLLEFIDD